MQANELRRTAVLIERTDLDAIDRAADYLRACADALDAGPVAWTLQETLDKRETTHRAHLWFVDPQNSAWAALYTLPIPDQAHTLRLPEPMTRAELDEVLDEYGSGDGVRHYEYELCRGIEADTLRRVKEVNE